jgi:tRNA/rRNA methyltransferase
MELTGVRFVLVRPARAANVAAACRALKNMGLGPPVIVGPPPPGLDAPEARSLAYGAWDLLDGLVPAPSLADAVGGCSLVAGTSSRSLDDAWTPRRMAEEARTRVGRMAVVFGPEASGLTREELDVCTVRVRVPTAEAQPSLNLAQAVLVLAYELRLALSNAPATPATPPATAEELEAALAQLRESLVRIGYLNGQNPDAVLAELRRLAARARPSPREVALLRGLARQIAWAGGAVRNGNP